MRILISGSTGFLATALIAAMKNEGHQWLRLVRPSSSRRDAGEPTVRWDPLAGDFESGAAEGADAVVHLAGASIAEGRWTPARKELLRASRVAATKHLVGALAKLARPPRIFVAASAIGYYGDRGEEQLTETSAAGDDFLAALSREWEAETAHAAQFGARTVMLRFGIILAADGGALPRMVLPFKFGVGGRLGNGRQWLSWLTLNDAVGMLRFALTGSGLQGPINAVSPSPVRNADFTRLLAQTLRRPALFPAPAPAFALRLLLGEMADALLLSSQRVLPTRLEQAGYGFAQTDLRIALQSIFRPPS